MPIRRLFLAPEEWAALPQKLSDPYFAALARNNRRAIEAYEARRGRSLVDVPSDLDDHESPRVAMTSCRPIKGRLLRAAIALHACGDETVWPFASETIDFLLQPDLWCSHSEFCRIHHFDLRSGDLLYTACFTLDAFAERLDEDRRRRLIELMLTRGLAAYLRGWEEREWWRDCDFNWGPATHGNAGLAALALAEVEPGLCREVLEKALAGLQCVIEHFPQDGWWSEGSMYQTTMLGHLSDFVIAYHRLTGKDLGLSVNPRFFEMLETRPEALAPDGRLYNFSNCPSSLVGFYLPQVYWWAQRCQKPEWTAYEDTIVKPWSDSGGVFYDVQAFFFRPAHPELKKIARRTGLHRFRGLDWLTWRGKQTWLSIRCGQNGGNHNNLDLGHFIFGRGETRYLADPGYGAVETRQHNAVTIRGKSQADASLATILAADETPCGIYVACDLTGCHLYVLRYHRRHLILWGDDRLVVIDHLGGKGGRRVSARYHFQTPLSVKPASKGCTLLAEEGDLAIRSLTAHRAPELQEWTSREGRFTTIGFYAFADLVEELSIFDLSFAGAPPLACEIDSGGHSVRLSQGGSTCFIDLADAACNIQEGGGSR